MSGKLKLQEGVMVHWDKVEGQLERIGCNFQFWGRSEARELCHVLMDEENIAHCVNGQYVNGFAMLCATDHRVLLIDKKPMNFLNVEDVRFEMISEFDYSHRMMNATVSICSSTKTLKFTSWNQHRLRALLSYVQQRVIEIRQYQYMAQQFQQQALEAMQQRASEQQPTYVPNLAMQAPGGNSSPAQTTSGLGDAARTLGAYLPHFRSRGTKHLGKYAIPDDIYPDGRF
jgi:hypothetical protein